MSEVRIKMPDLENFVGRAFEAVDVPRDDARVIAELMARADINGSDGHGVFRLPQYIRRIKGGAANVRPNIRLERETAAMALVNGDNGMAHLVMRFAAETAIEKAKQTAAAWVGARWSNHAGPASLYASMALEHDMIGLYLPVGSADHLPPWGGLDWTCCFRPILWLSRYRPGKSRRSFSTWRRPSRRTAKAKRKLNAAKRCPWGWSRCMLDDPAWRCCGSCLQFYEFGDTTPAGALDTGHLPGMAWTLLRAACRREPLARCLA
jgi:hypothetical protein